MNNYIVLDGLKYVAQGGSYRRVGDKPMTTRYTLSGGLDATFGPSDTPKYSGILMVPVTPRDVDWGDIDDFRASIAKRQKVGFVDHYNASHVVVVNGPHPEDSFTNMWDAASNEFKIPAEFIIDPGGGALVIMDTLEIEGAADEMRPRGKVNVAMGTLSLDSEPEFMFVSRPVIMSELILLGITEMNPVPKNALMNTLSLVGSAENHGVGAQVSIQMNSLTLSGSAENSSVA